MMVLIAVVVVALVGTNLYLFRELSRLRHRTKRLALLARNEARRVRSIDWATAQAFARVHATIAAARPASAEPAKPPAAHKPSLLN